MSRATTATRRRAGKKLRLATLGMPDMSCPERMPLPSVDSAIAGFLERSHFRLSAAGVIQNPIPTQGSWAPGAGHVTVQFPGLGA